MNSLTELVSGMEDSGSCWLCSGDFPSGRGRECIEDKGLWLGDWWHSETCKVCLKQDHLQPGSRQASHLAWSIVYSVVKREWFWTPSLPKLLWRLRDILCVFSMFPGLSSIVCDYHAPPPLPYTVFSLPFIVSMAFWYPVHLTYGPLLCCSTFSNEILESSVFVPWFSWGPQSMTNASMVLWIFVIDSCGPGRQMEQKDLGNRTHQKIFSRCCYQKKCSLRDQTGLVGLGMLSLNGCLNYWKQRYMGGGG